MTNWFADGAGSLRVQVDLEFDVMPIPRAVVSSKCDLQPTTTSQYPVYVPLMDNLTSFPHL